ncbi:hypothetical protein DCAR_0728854 [Daucus carota subsp. sativus]|uniref:Uncharacterized protein n=1 Tax=Daucus carota subsp. sativus TaxID=79200 RepID=A0A161X6M5_DAUCS|nr:PREDICTED: probable carboxylesterase 8 [Daucus carota subsp. sativus]WOH09397.1 hypothetical protein DCAR_0728854 [Daucus carota subsp. sativus]
MAADLSLIDEPYKFLKIALNPDGSLTREDQVPQAPAMPELASETANPPSQKQVALSKDIPLNATNQTFIRLFRPLKHTTKLPVIIDFHGGGFILYSAISAPFNDLWNIAAAVTPALIITVEYRLAPEHRLPAAYDDAMEAILWVRDQARDVDGCDPWMKELADYSNVHIMGTSAGGNIAYHAGLRSLDVDISPIQIKGLILNQPFFGGVERTSSEEKLSRNPYLPVSASDLMWLLSLPLGSDRDHEYSNPLDVVNPKITSLPRCLIRGFEGDALVDRMKGLAKLLDAHGVKVVSKFEEGGFHGAEVSDPRVVQELFSQLKDFIYSS